MTDPRHEPDDDGSVDVEAAWADIVAHWDDAPATPPAGVTGAVQTDNGTEDRPDGATQAGVSASGDPASPVDSGTDAAGGTGTTHDLGDDWEVPRSRVGGDQIREAAEREDATEAALDDEERFVPPEPPPLPRGDTVSRLAWAGVLGAPLFFLLAALFWHGAPTWLVVGAVGAFVAGFVTLIVRMPDRDDDGDDGAVV
ncbi:MAG TPA: hypothetical protein VFX33_15340 [Actinomycetales bacterium]|nr:hypothetical protein [Actinomycetales bacterium]